MDTKVNKSEKLKTQTEGSRSDESISVYQNETADSLGGDLSQKGKTKFGILYFIWHCTTKNNIYDLSEFLAGKSELGPFPAFHWWTEPEAGYYCLTEREDIIRLHAEQLRDAGIDYIVVDVTNWAHQSPTNSKIEIIDPFKKLLKAFSEVENAPKVVPWVPIYPGADMVYFLLEELNKYPGLKYIYQGKPLLLAVDHNSKEEEIAFFRSAYTVRRMWGHNDVAKTGKWSFLQPCSESASFKASGGNQKCQQRFTKFQNRFEQISITTSYQHTYMSHKATAVPKFGGNTFRRQFETLLDHPTIENAIITGWNEWIAQRFCPDGGITNCPGQYAFVDAFDHEYNRDIEPSRKYGDTYYQLLKEQIDLYHQKYSTDQKPLISVDRIDNDGTLHGWAFDPDDKGQEITVEIFTKNSDGTTNLLKSIHTSLVRADVETRFSVTAKTGFQYKVAETWRGHQIYVKAKNIGQRPSNDGIPSLYPILFRNTGDPEYQTIPLHRYLMPEVYHRITTLNLDQYQKEITLGKLATTSTSSTRELFECLAGSKDYFISHDYQCEGHTFISRLGYIFINQDNKRKPLYRCVDEYNGNHFASHDPACEGKRTEALMGYLDP